MRYSQKSTGLCAMASRSSSSFSLSTLRFWLCVCVRVLRV